MNQTIKSLLVLLVFCALANGMARRKRLVGGTEANINQFPFMAAIKNKDTLKCGAVIVGKNKVLTSAQCVEECRSEGQENKLPKDCEDFKIIIGSSSLSKSNNVYHIKSVKIDDKFDPQKFAHGIAVITLQSDLTFSDNIKAISLPDKDITEGSSATSAGWGIVKDTNKEKPSDLLRSLEATVMSSSQCKTLFDKLLQLDENEFCAVPVPNKSNLCTGDTGNPLVQDGKLIGIATWGLGCDGRYPDAYTNVFKYLDFIKKELA